MLAFKRVLVLAYKGVRAGFALIDSLKRFKKGAKFLSNGVKTIVFLIAKNCLATRALPSDVFHDTYSMLSSLFEEGGCCTAQTLA